MVYFERERRGLHAVWLDGRLPTKRTLNTKCSQRQLNAIGLNHEVLASSEHLALDSNGLEAKYNIFANLASAFVQNHMTRYVDEQWSYQLLVVRPSCDDSPTSAQIRRARCKRFNSERFFAADDPLLQAIPEHEFLRIPPYIPRLREENFFQLVALYPASYDEWTWDHVSGQEYLPAGPIAEFRDYLEIDTPEPEAYYNYRIFDSQLRKLLRESVECARAGKNLGELLRSRGFQILQERVSS